MLRNTGLTIAITAVVLAIKKPKSIWEMGKIKLFI